MSLKIETYTRKTFDVETVEVTADNMHEVARWCGGDVVQPESPNDSPFVRVPVINPTSERQTRAVPGDRILYSGKSYKVYTEKAFLRSFSRKTPNPTANAPIEHVEAKPTVENVFDGPKHDVIPGGKFPTFSSPPKNPGGTHS